jgi:hypothetical protein
VIERTERLGVSLLRLSSLNADFAITLSSILTVPCGGSPVTRRRYSSSKGKIATGAAPSAVSKGAPQDMAQDPSRRPPASGPVYDDPLVILLAKAIAECLQAERSAKGRSG